MPLRLAKGSAGLRKLSAALDGFCAEHALAEDVRHDLQLVVDEIVNNAVRHAAPRHPLVEVNLAVRDRMLEIVIVDDGDAFDVRRAPAPDVTLPIADRGVGGLGLLLVQQLMDEVKYRRAGGRNRLTLRRRLAGRRPARGPAPAP